MTRSSSAEDKLVLQSAHSTGKTCFAFSRDGSTAYTGGADSLVRIWNLDGGGEPDTALDSDDAISSIAVDVDGWLSGSSDSHVRRYLRRSAQIEGLITRAAGVPIRCVATDPKGRRVAVTSDELTVKVIELDEITNIKLLEGHKKGVRTATWHPSGSLLTTCGADGKIIVWDVSGDEVKQDRVLEGIIPAVSDTESKEFSHDCAAVWHPSGVYFVAATKAHEIITVSRNTWSKVSTFSDEACIGDITALALSANGVYLASACKSGIFIWSTATRRVLFRHDTKTDVIVNQLGFSPTRNLLAWTDSDGAFTRWPNVIPPSSPDPVKPVASAVMPVPVRRGATPLLFGPDDDGAPAAGTDDDVTLDDPLDAGADDIEDDFIIDDLGGGMVDKPDRDSHVFSAREMVSVTKAQPPFQPGATPFVGKRRYLAFNNIGVIEVVDQDTHHIVNIEFHDQTTRKPYHFSDHFKFDLAAVGERGIVYACPPENDHQAQVNYKPYSTWASQSEWTYALPKGERVVAVAAGGSIPRKSLRTRNEGDVEGNGYVAVATNKGLVRFFSGGGIQRGPIWAIDGEVVAMVAGRDYVFVVHREGGTSLDGNQNLKYTLRTSDTFRVMHTGRLPVNKGDTLKWIGITDEGAPIIYDSAERVLILEHYRFTSQGSWAVILDAKTLSRRSGKDESYWPVGVTNSIFMCIILKGREKHPGFPRPLVQEIEMKMPYLEMDSAEAQKEERLSRETILLDQIRDTLEEDVLTTADISRTELDLDKELIQLIQLACKHDKLQRALDAAKLLHVNASFEMAMKVADFYHLPGLQEKIGFLLADRTEADRLREDRDRRKGWRRTAGAVPPAAESAWGQGQSVRPFQDVQPPPAIRRPGLAAATPSEGPSPFSRRPKATTPTLVQDSPEPETFSSADGKRKRGDLDRNAINEDETQSDSNAKRRATDENGAAVGPKSRPNPFAKKPRESVDETTSVNPFQKKVTAHKSMHKSESFFNKVDAAEAEGEKDSRQKGKGKALTSKQTTLFHMAMGPTKNSGKGKKTDDHEMARVVETQESTVSQQSESTLVVDPQSQIETQVADIDGTATQPAVTDQTESQMSTADMEDDVPIEWPDSPARMEDVLEASPD